MDILTALQERHSVRAFQDKKISREIWHQVLEHAFRAPSWKNCQPARLHIVEGEQKDHLSAALLEAAQSGQPDNPDEPWPASWPPAFKKRMFQLGMDLYSHMGIDRKDKAARDQFMLENYKFFGAPAVILVTTPREFGFWPELDIGIFLGQLELALLSQGIGSCFQASLAAWPELVRELLGYEENHKLLVGISVGYPDQDALVNRFRSTRLPLGEFCQFH